MKVETDYGWLIGGVQTKDHSFYVTVEDPSADKKLSCLSFGNFDEEVLFVKQF